MPDGPFFGGKVIKRKNCKVVKCHYFKYQIYKYNNLSKSLKMFNVPYPNLIAIFLHWLQKNRKYLYYNYKGKVNIFTNVC